MRISAICSYRATLGLTVTGGYLPACFGGCWPADIQGDSRGVDQAGCLRGAWFWQRVALAVALPGRVRVSGTTRIRIRLPRSRSWAGTVQKIVAPTRFFPLLFRSTLLLYSHARYCYYLPFFSYMPRLPRCCCLLGSHCGVLSLPVFYCLF